jgi:hypothetical protein
VQVVPTSRLKEAVMYAVVRSYSGQGASELFDQLEQRNEEIKDLIGGVPGFVSYTAGRKGIGLIAGARTAVGSGGVDEWCRRRSGDRRECVVAEFAEDVVGAAAEFARD